MSKENICQPHTAGPNHVLARQNLVKKCIDKSNKKVNSEKNSHTPKVNSNLRVLFEFCMPQIEFSSIIHAYPIG